MFLLADAEVTRWHLGIAALSMRRFVRFWPEMGLPGELILKSFEVIDLSQHFMRKTMRDTSVEVGRERLTQLTFTNLQGLFDRISKLLSPQTAIALCSWLRWYVVNESTTSALFTWRELLRTLSGQLTVSDFTMPRDIKGSTVARIKELVVFQLSPARLQQIRSDIRGILRLQRCDWESELDSWVKTTAGVDPALDSVAMVADLVEKVIYSRLTHELLWKIDHQLTKGEITTLIGWAQKEARLQRLQAPLAWVTEIQEL